MTGDILDAKQLAECAQRYVDLISSHDIDALCGLFAADAIQEDPVGHEISKLNSLVVPDVLEMQLHFRFL